METTDGKLPTTERIVRSKSFISGWSVKKVDFQPSAIFLKCQHSTKSNFFHRYERLLKLEKTPLYHVRVLPCMSYSSIICRRFCHFLN